MRVDRIAAKDPAEIVPVTFDFSALAASIDSIVAVTASVKSGADPSVGAMLYGAATISGTEVRQLVRNGVSGAIYLLRADIAKGSERYALACYLPVEALT
jgi:hypothetical protein